MRLIYLLPIILLATLAQAQDEPLSTKTYPQYPQTTLENDVMSVHLYLPDAENGYYRGTRFDWSGVISRVEYAGHTFYGEWKEGHNPRLHDDITGPVEEFSMDDPLGYSEAGPGDPFVKIGVGTLLRKDNSDYRFAGVYEIAEAGGWDISQGEGWIEFTQDFTGPDGWAYLYIKRIDLAENNPRFSIYHYLENTGQKRIDTTHYNHNFTIIDDEPIGPGYEITFPFEIEASGDLKGRARVEGNTFKFIKPNEPDSVFTAIAGFESGPAANDILIKNTNTGAGIHAVGDTAPFKINLWSIRWTVSPEPFIDIELDPGEAMEWNYHYTFTGATAVH